MGSFPASHMRGKIKDDGSCTFDILTRTGPSTRSVLRSRLRNLEFLHGNRLGLSPAISSCLQLAPKKVKVPRALS